jgi:hypothetical protein
MSGAFGWKRNDNADDDKPSVKPAGYDDAAKRYQPQGGPSVIHVNPARPQAGGNRPPDPSMAPRVMPKQVPARTAIPGAKHALKTKAANVLIIEMDATGSMKEWPAEIFKRLPLLYQDAAKYLGSEDLEILFIVIGDAKTDEHPLQVARFGKGPELDGILASFDLEHCDGGGNGGESHELAALYLHERVDTKAARNVHAFIITDEPPFVRVDPQECRTHLGIELNPELAETPTIFQSLRRRMHVHALLCDTGSYHAAPIIARWKGLLGDEGVIQMSDHRRAVDVMLGTLATVTGQLDRFTQDLQSRQLGTRFGNVNVQAVLKSIALIGRGTPSSPHVLPKGMTRPLLPPPDDDDDNNT